MTAKHEIATWTETFLMFTVLPNHVVHSLCSMVHEEMSYVWIRDLQCHDQLAVRLVRGCGLIQQSRERETVGHSWSIPS